MRAITNTTVTSGVRGAELNVGACLQAMRSERVQAALVVAALFDVGAHLWAKNGIHAVGFFLSCKFLFAHKWAPTSEANHRLRAGSYSGKGVTR
jgi:hypothetical protein